MSAPVIALTAEVVLLAAALADTLSRRRDDATDRVRETSGDRASV